MTAPSDSASDSTRRIRPWIAGLLTFLGWGVGLYYARKTRAAIYAVAGQVLATALIAGALITYLAASGPLKLPAVNPNGLSLSDIISFVATAIIAIGVFVFVAKQNAFVEKSGPTRLFGYVGIWLLPIIGAALIALAIRIFLFQPFSVPAGSMKPTLQIGEFFAVDKRSFGYSKASLTYPSTRIALNGRIFANAPMRGDVVVFKNRKYGNKDYVKRLIGLPGDQIQMIGGVLYINDERVKKDFIEVRENTCGGGGDALIYRETLNNGVSYFVQECSGDQGGLDNVGPYLVPEGHYFMLGDNRDQSQDSRIMAAVGYIPYDDLVGKALIRER